jgi:hypothetical protein
LVTKPIGWWKGSIEGKPTYFVALQ